MKQDPNFVTPEDRPVAEVVKPSYQPSKAELDTDVKVNATFGDAVAALVRLVKINYIQRPEARK